MPQLKHLFAIALISAVLTAPAARAAETQAHAGGIYEAVGPDTAAISAVKTASAGAVRAGGSGWSSLLAAQEIFLEIPEAPSAALLIIGLAAVGVAARRRAR